MTSTHARRSLHLVVGLLALLSLAPITARAEAGRPSSRRTDDAWPQPPAADDLTAESLRDFGARVIAAHGGHYREVPLEAKARFFDWQLWRYHQAPTGQVYNRVRVPSKPSRPPVFVPGPDTSTWNGALLAALSYQYAVTRDPAVLERIESLLRGFDLFLAATSQPGLLARSIALTDSTAEDGMAPFTAPDGERYHFRSDAAKGTYNQVVGGYVTMLSLIGDDLPKDVRKLARRQLGEMVWHVVRHDYHLTERNGQRTQYGDLTPVVGGFGVPFNAQVAYMIVAAGHYFPPKDRNVAAAIHHQFGQLRERHHAYYERPLQSLVLPQRIGATRFVKGMNDRNHVTNAAYVGMLLDVENARRRGTELDRLFLFRLGRTMYWSMQYLEGHHNSLCNFMWVGLLSDQRVFDCVIDHKPNTARAQMERLAVSGVEQLRRFKLNRFSYQGQERIAPSPQWVDTYRPDDYHWKCNPNAVWQVTSGPTNNLHCAIDYLYAYWLMRYYEIDRRPEVVARHKSVL